MQELPKNKVISSLREINREVVPSHVGALRRARLAFCPPAEVREANGRAQRGLYEL